MLEKTLQAKILRYLKTMPNCWTVKTITSNKSGVPDIIACINGKFVAIEVKQKNQKATPIQEYNGKKIQEANGEWHLVNDYDQFLTIIRKTR
jgi:hypothetical protein